MRHLGVSEAVEAGILEAPTNALGPEAPIEDETQTEPLSAEAQIVVDRANEHLTNLEALRAAQQAANNSLVAFHEAFGAVPADQRQPLIDQAPSVYAVRHHHNNSYGNIQTNT
jgi:hypothetical protein